jgi:predicted Fe-Mo cluster-binding NifX family protein
MIPVESEEGLLSEVAQHFGRAPFFAIVELDENCKIIGVRTEKNKSEHMGGAPGHSHESFLSLKPDVVVAFSMGPGALNTFKEEGIPVLQAKALTVEENIAEYNEDKLEELTGGCEHAHHHEHNH